MNEFIVIAFTFFFGMFGVVFGIGMQLNAASYSKPHYAIIGILSFFGGCFLLAIGSTFIK